MYPPWSKITVEKTAAMGYSSFGINTEERQNMSSYTVSLSSLINHHKLTALTRSVDISNVEIGFPEVNRPALQLAGFYDYFDSDRLQVIGNVEHAYLEKLSLKERKVSIEKLFSYKIPCIVICREITPFPEMISIAEKYGVPILQSSDQTSDFIAEVLRWLKVELAPRETVHGVLVDIYGEGVLIMGESGVGKSETALELIKRGHRLVADDAVEIKKVSEQTLIGICPEILRYFIELRGIGIIDVKQMFGVQSIKATQNIDLIIKFEIWNEKKDYDRLGLNDEYMEILGMKVICHSLPIRPGRNLSVICESAAINHRQKKMGYHAAKVLSERVESRLTGNS